MDIDNILFLNKGHKGDIKGSKGTIMTQKEIKKTKNSGIGLDVGTGYICSNGYKNEKPDFKLLRNAFFSIDKKSFSKNTFNKQQMKFVEIGENVNVIGDDALVLSRIQNSSAKRPLANGVINNKEKASAPILKKMFEYCVMPFKKEEGETCVFSIPGNIIGEENFDVDFHSMSIESLLSSFGLNPIPLNEAYAVILSEMETSKNITGLGFSFGAGLVNVAFVYKSMLVFSFSINKSGDFIDQKSASVCGLGESVMNHLKENELDLSIPDFELSSELRTLKFTYKYVIKNVLNNVITAFNKNNTANIIEPIPLVISGGTTLPTGFMKMFEDEVSKIQLPFKITKIIPAKDRLKSVAKGCFIYAKGM